MIEAELIGTSGKNCSIPIGQQEFIGERGEINVNLTKGIIRLFWYRG